MDLCRWQERSAVRRGCWQLLLELLHAVESRRGGDGDAVSSRGWNQRPRGRHDWIWNLPGLGQPDLVPSSCSDSFSPSVVSGYALAAEGGAPGDYDENGARGVRHKRDPDYAKHEIPLLPFGLVVPGGVSGGTARYSSLDSRPIVLDRRSKFGTALVLLDGKKSHRI